MCVVQPSLPLLFSIIAAGHMSVVNIMLQVLLHIESLLFFESCVGDGFDPLSWEKSFSFRRFYMSQGEMTMKSCFVQLRID